MLKQKISIKYLYLLPVIFFLIIVNSFLEEFSLSSDFLFFLGLGLGLLITEVLLWFLIKVFSKMPSQDSMITKTQSPIFLFFLTIIVILDLWRRLPESIQLFEKGNLIFISSITCVLFILWYIVSTKQRRKEINSFNRFLQIINILLISILASIFTLIAISCYF